MRARRGGALEGSHRKWFALVSIVLIAAEPVCTASARIRDKYRPGLRIVNHVETLGVPGTSYSALSSVNQRNAYPEDAPMMPFQPLQPGQSVRGDDSFPLASPMSIMPEKFTAKPPTVSGLGGVTDEEGANVYDNSPPNWLTKARTSLGLTEKEGAGN
jgi:hypothetical protein